MFASECKSESVAVLDKQMKLAKREDDKGVDAQIDLCVAKYGYHHKVIVLWVRL